MFDDGHKLYIGRVSVLNCSYHQGDGVTTWLPGNWFDLIGRRGIRWRIMELGMFRPFQITNNLNILINV